MDTSNIYRYNGVDPFDNWTIKNNCLYGYYPRNSIINGLSQLNGLVIDKDTLIVPKGVISICGSCFRGNTKYKKVIIPSSIRKISDNAFKDTDITIVINGNNKYAERYTKRKGIRFNSNL